MRFFVVRARFVCVCARMLNCPFCFGDSIACTALGVWNSCTLLCDVKPNVFVFSERKETIGITKRRKEELREKSKAFRALTST